MYLDLGGTTVEVMHGPEATWIPPRSGDTRLGWQCLAIEVEDIDEALAMLRGHGVDAAWGPVKQPDCARAEIRDPDGNPIELRQWYRRRACHATHGRVRPEESENVAMDHNLPALPSIEFGRYRHYKGGEYEVLGVVRHSESLEPLVLYRPLRGNTGSWVRPFAMFLEPVMHDGRHTPRFARVGAGAPATEDELAATVHRMESALHASSAGGVRQLMEHYQKVSVRFEQDLGAWPRDLLLAKASALMLVQAAAAGS